MGAGKQEKFLLKLVNLGWGGLGFTSGGFFHQSAKRYNYYHAWIDQLNLRWLYRILNEPKLLWRYSVDYLRFVFVFFYDLLVYKANN